MEYIFPRISVLIYFGIGTIILGVLVLLGISFGKKSPLNYILGSIVCIVIGIIIIFVSKGGTLKIVDQTVTMKIPMFSEKSFSFDEIEQFEVVELNRDSPYFPVKRKTGTGTKNFNSGWFQLKNGEKAFLLLEGWKKGIYVKTKSGDVFLIGIKNLDELIEQFPQAAGDSSAVKNENLQQND